LTGLTVWKTGRQALDGEAGSAIATDAVGLSIFGAARQIGNLKLAGESPQSESPQSVTPQCAML
jgi:hypothetical protein